MGKPLAYRLFGFGKLPKKVAKKDNDIVDEGVRIHVHYKDFKAPGKRFKNKRRMMIGSLLVNKNRMAFYVSSHSLMDISPKDPRFKKLRIKSDGEEAIEIKFNASDFSDNASGEVSYKLQTERVADIMKALRH